MKTKIVYLVSLLCALTFATSAFADSESGFYEKDHVRGFISVGADYRGMFEGFSNYVNTIAFLNPGHVIKSETSGSEEFYAGNMSYSKFDDYYLGLHLNIGAQYKQFLTWFDINFMPTQISERPSSTYTAVSDSGYGMKFPLYDVRWFCYGADWMFGWKLFGEHTFINLIPSVGFGFNIINFHYASNFTLEERDNPEHTEIVRDRFYSTMATTLTGELEFRIELGRLGLGGYGGYRFVRYNDPDIEGFTNFKGKNETDNVGDTWYLGVRATWYFLSQWEKKQADKL